MDKSLDKLLACEYECDFCKIEIPLMVEYRNEQRTRREQQPFYKKIFDTYLELIPRTTQPKSWNIHEIKQSDVGRLTLLKYLQSSDNNFIPEKRYNILLNKFSVFLCDHHIYELDKHIVSKGKYCVNCGEDYSIEESEHIGLDIVTGRFHAVCRRCQQDSLMLPIVGITQTQGYKQYCVDCKKHIEYGKNEFGEANPRYIIKQCFGCGGGNLQHIKTVKYVWSSKEL